MKMKNKGFTAVELVIVIAVIAILAAVLIPTFTNIINESQKSSALQEVNAAYKIAYNAVYDDGKIEEGEGIAVDLFEFTFAENGEDVAIYTQENSPYRKFNFDYSNGTITITN